MRLLVLVSVAATLLALCCVPAGLAAPTGHTSRPCGDLFAPNGHGHDGGAGMQLAAVRGISCRAARRVARRCVIRRHVTGWHAKLGVHDSLNMIMTSGRRRIRMRGTAGGAPMCFQKAYDQFNTG